jgi:hypothetical protein
MEDVYGTSSENHVEQWSQDLWNGTLSQVQSPFHCHTNQLRTKFWLNSLKERDSSEDQAVDSRMKKTDIRETG